MLNRNDFENCVREIESFYNGSILNGGIMEATWFGTLKHLSIGQLQLAIGRCFKKHPRAYNFFPSADQILEFAQGEYRPPGETGGIPPLNAPVLPSHEDRLTPAQIAELNKRGRLVARIILNSTGYMTPERKEELIEQFKTTPTHELEMIAATSEQTKKSSSFNNIRKVLEKIEQDIHDANSESSFEQEAITEIDTRKIAKQWLGEDQ